MKRIITLSVSLLLISLVSWAQTAPTSFTAGTRTSSSLQFSWSAGTGGDDYYIVRHTSATITDLVNGTPYSVSDVLANGTVVGITASTTFTDNPPNPETQYFYKVFNHANAGNLYSSGLTGNMTTYAAEPNADPTGLAFSNITGTSLTLTWNPIGTPVNSGTDRIVLVNLNSSSSVAPVDGTIYSDNPAYGSGGTTGTDNFVVYKGTGTSVDITNLAPNTEYKFSVVAFNGSGGTENYKGSGTSSNQKMSPQITSVAFSTPAANTPIGIGTATVTITVGDDLGVTHTLVSGTVAGYTLSNLLRTNSTTYTAQFTITNGGTDIPAGDVIPVADLVLNNGTISNPAYAEDITQPNDVLDANLPAVVSSNYLTPATSPTNATSLVFQVTFSESVTGVAAGNFTAILTGGVSANPITTVTGSGTTYDVTVPNVGGATTGTVRLDVDNTPVVSDVAGNTTTGTYNSGQVYDIDKVPPAFSATAPATSAFVNHTKVSYTLSKTIASGIITWTAASGPGFPATLAQPLSGGELLIGAHTDITLNSPPTLVDGTVYNVKFEGTDAAGNVATPITNTSVTYDVSAPTTQNTVYASSSTVLGGSSVTIVSSGDINNSVWFAPSGTTVFVAGPTMTKATNGTSTSILAPTTSGDYKLFVVDQAGNISTESTATLSSSTAPSTPASAINFTNVTDNSMTVNWINGNGQRRIVIARLGGAVTNDPTNFTSYTASSNWNNGAPSGSLITNGYVVYDGTGNSFSFTNLEEPGVYHFGVYEYNGTSTLTGAFNMTQPIASQAVIVQATNLVFSSPGQTTMTAAWTNGTGTNRIAIAKTSGATFTPVNGTTYTANADFSGGANIGSGGTVKCIFNGSGATVPVTNLVENTLYTFQVYEYTGAAGFEVYNAVSSTNNPLDKNTIEATEPTSNATATFTAVTGTSLTYDVTGNGNGASRMIIVSDAAISFNPTDGTSYTANPDVSLGTDLDGVPSGATTFIKVVGFGSSPITVSGLTANTTYFFAAFEFNGTQGTGAENYYNSEDEINRKTKPTSQASFTNFSGIGINGLTINWSGGNGDRTVVLAHQGAPVDADPVDLTNYTASGDWNSGSTPTGTQIGTGNYLVYDGTGTSAALTELVANTVYHFAIYEYNGSGLSSAGYLTPGATASRSTLATQPTNASTGITFSNITNNSITVGKTSGAGTGTSRMLVARPGAAVNFTPTDGVSYNTQFNADYSLATEVGTPADGNKIVGLGNGASFTVTGLSDDQIYHFALIELNGTVASGAENYFGTTLTGSRNTEPTAVATSLIFSTVAPTVSTIQLNWTNPVDASGGGDRRIVVVREGATVKADPTDFTLYTPNTNWATRSAANEIGSSGNYVVFNGTGSSVALTNLQANTTYHFEVYEYNSYVNGSVQTATTAAAFLTPSVSASQATLADGTPPAAITIGTVTAKGGGNEVAGYFNLSNTTLEVVIPFGATNMADPTLDLGKVQLQLKQSSPGSTSYTNIAGALDAVGSGYSTITNAERLAGTKTMSISKANLLLHPDFDDGATFQITAIITDFSNNSAPVTQSATNTVRDETRPTVTGANFFASYLQSNDASFTSCNGTNPSNSQGTIREYVHLTVSEPLNITNGGLPSIVTGSTSYGFNAANYNGAFGGAAYATFDIACDNRGGTAYHPTNVIHLQAEYLVGNPTFSDELWTNATTFSFTSGGSNVKDLAGNEMASIPVISTTATAPLLASSMVLDPDPTGVNTPERITFTVDQTLSTSTAADAVTGITVDADGAGPGAPVSRPGTYSTTGNTVTVTSTADGQWTSATTVIYTSGSGTPLTTTVPMASFGPERILLGPVTITSNNANTSLAKEGNTISVTFTANPGALPLSGSPFSAATISGIDVLPSLTGSNPYTVSLVTSGATPVPESAVAFSITADQAGRTTVVTKTNPGSSVTYDKTIPAKPAIPDLAAADDSGPGAGANADNYTKTNSDLSFSGTVDNSSTTGLGATVTIYNNGVPLGTTTANAGTGAWSFEAYPFPATLADGTYNITVKATDAAGNESLVSDPLVLTIDNTPPNVVSILRVTPPNLNSWSTTNGTSANSVTFRITFDENVTGLDYSGGGGGGGSSNFQRNTTGSVSTSSFTGSAFTTSNYVDVTVSGISGTGQLSANFLDKDNVVNAVGDPVGGVGIGNGDFVTNFNPLDEYYTVVLPEPTSSVTSFGQATTTTSVTVSWNHAVIPPTQATHYLIRLKKSTSAFSPVTFTDGIPGGIPGNDGVDFTDTDFSDGTLAAYVTYPTNNHTFTGLASGMQYNIEIYPLTYNANYGTDNWNYKFSAPLTGNATTGVGQQTTISFVSVAPTISSLQDTPGEIFDVFTFQIQDDGSSPTIDNAASKFSGLTIVPAGVNGISDWTQAIGGASLTTSVGGTIAGTVQYNVFSPSTSSIVFSAGTSDDPTDFGFIDDNQAKSYTLSIWLKPDMDGALNLPSIIDGLRFAFLTSSTNFTLENGTLSQSSSQFLAGTSAQSGSAITVDVAASKLVFATPGTPGTATNPQSSIGVGTSFLSSSAADPLVYALDVNNNLDLDYETALGNSGSISNTQSLGQSVNSVTFTNGVSSLNPLAFTTAGTNTQIVVAGVGSPSVTSATSTNVTAVISNKTTISDATAPASELASFSSITNALPSNFNFDFTITDDVGANTSTFDDNDALPTLIQTITIAQNSNNGTNGGGDVTTFDDWTKSIGGAELTDGVSSVTISPGPSITGNTLVFNVSATSMATVAEGTPKTYALRIWLKNPVDATLRDILDNKDFAFNIDQSNIIINPADANATSTMANSSASSGDGRNIVTVTATQLDFVTQPPATQDYDVNLTTTPVVKARDANQNLDLNYTSNATLTSVEALTPSFPLSTTAFTFVGGVVSLTPVAVGSSGGGLNNNIIQLQLNDNPNVISVASALSSNIQLTYSGESDIVKDNTFITSGAVGNTYTPNIEFINNIDSVNLTAANSVALERFLLRDGGSDLTDTDGSNTKLASITLNIENYLNIKRIGIYDGATEIQELTNTSFSGTGDITFTGISTFEATDNTQKALTVRVSFKTKVTDNQALRVRVVSATAGGVSSQISSASTTFVTLTGNDNKIEVVATKITFDNAPASASANVSVNPPASPLRVTARDLYNNHDLDYNGAISFSGTPPASGNTANYDVANLPTANFAGGILDYPVDNLLTPLVDEGYQFLSGTTFTRLTIDGAVANLAGSVHHGSPITGISPAPGVEIKTSFDSWLYFDPSPSFSYTTRIPYVTMQETTLTNSTNSVELARLVLSDGGAPGSTVTATNTSPGTKNMAFGQHNDIDAAFTKIEGFEISLTNFSDIRKIALFDASGVKVPGTEQNAAATVTFTGLGSVSSLWAADDDVSRFYIRASFNSTVGADRDTIIMQITDVVWSSGSRFPLTDGSTTVGGINGTGTSGDTSDATKNIINVVVTKFDFTGSQHSYAGIDQPVPLFPGSAYEVRAHDQFNNLDTEFNYASDNTLYAVTVTAPSGPLSGSFTFSNGVMVMSDLQYTSVGDGKLTVTSNANSAVNSNVNSPAATPPNVADPSDAIHVVHTQASINTNGPTTANNLKGGTNNVVIFGVTLTVNNPDNANLQPKLKQFTFSFDKAYRTGPTTATLKNFKVFESLTGAYVSGITPNVTLNNATVSEGKSSALVNANHRDLVTVTFADGSYRNIGNNTYTFYLMCDIDATASNATPPLRPQLLRGGYNSADSAYIQVTEGSVFADVLGTEFGFASVKPPKLVSSVPANGQLNVDPNQSTIELTFDVPVWTLDGKAYLYDSAGNKIADLSAINGRNIPPTFNEGVTGGLNSPTPPLTFTIPVALGDNQVYYVIIEKGVNDIQNPSNNRGIMDDQSNLFGGITYSGGLRFKTANPNAPKLKDTDSNKYFISASGGVINGSFDQRGKAYFMVTNSGATAPTKAQITGTPGYIGGTVYGRDTIDIKLINTLQYGSFTAITPLAPSPTQYAVWMYAENDALPTPIATAFPYLSAVSNFALNTTNAAVPTFTFSYTPTAGLYLNKPGFQICSESFVTLPDPIILEEGALTDFYYDHATATDVQSFNMLLPQGFEFDRNTLPNVELIGEFTGKATVVFTNNTILKVSFINTGSSKIDKIVITGIRLRGESGLATASIQRLGGNAIPGLADEADLATISVLDADPDSFTNSYTILNQTAFVSIGINNVVTVIPDNFSDPSLTALNSTKLISTIVGDYGPVEFTGSGVSNEVLSLSGVTLNTSFPITMKHTDMNGCVSSVTEQYLVYDHNTAIPGLPTKQAIVNNQFPGASLPFYPADSVTYATVSGYSLDTLIASIPDRITPGSQIIGRYSTSAWLTLIRQIPQWNPVTAGVSFNDYGFDYKSILNDSIYAGAGVLSKQAYNHYRETTLEGRYYWKGGSMGLIEYTGRYRNSADTSVLIPLRQEVEIFIPPIPVIEIAETEISGYDPTDPLHLANVGQPQLWPQGAPIFCENGNDILITGYPRAVQGLSTGSFSLEDASTSSPIISIGFIDNGNGTATLKPGLLTNGYDDIKIKYRFQEINSPIDSVGTLIIRISPNPIASFSASSVLDSANAIDIGRPSAINAYCVNNLIQFDNTSTANFPVPGYLANKNQEWTLGDPLSADNLQFNDSALFTYTTNGRYRITFSVWSQYNCPSQVASDSIYIGAIPDAAFDFSGISTLTPVVVADSSKVVDGIGTNSSIYSAAWTYSEGAPDTGSTASNLFTTPGHHTITLLSTTEITSLDNGTTLPGCERTFERPLIIVPALTATEVGVEALDDFEDSDPLKQWQPSDTSRLVSSWERGDATESSSINLTSNVWATDLDGPYNAGEVSFLYSPAYDLSSLVRPKVAFDQVAFLGINDGVALEFSVDTFNIADPLKKWFRVGTTDNGNNWYNKPGLASSPGDQTDYETKITAGDFGWSTQLDTVLHSQHTLSPDIPVGRRTNVIFRFALASLAGSTDQGFAFDNFRVGERTRVVLIENFSNLGNTQSINGENLEMRESNFLKGKFPVGSVGTDVIKLNYHVGFPEQDPFNNDYSGDPSARALFYNVSETPMARMDGGKPNDPEKKYFSGWGEEIFNIRTLQLAQAELQITPPVASANGGFKFSVTVTATNAKLSKDTTILHIAFVEANPILPDLTLVKTGETDFEYVVKKMVPSALGTRFSVELPIGQSITFNDLEWNPDLQKLYDNPNDLAIVAFIQNEFTREVYQAEILTSLTDPSLVTGTEDPDYAKKINLYPNPANSEVNIQLPAGVSKATPVTMFDSFGRTVYQDIFKVGEQTKTVKTSEFAGGIYFIQLNTPDGNIARRKVMVLHR